MQPRAGPNRSSKSLLLNDNDIIVFRKHTRKHDVRRSYDINNYCTTTIILHNIMTLYMTMSLYMTTCKNNNNKYYYYFTCFTCITMSCILHDNIVKGHRCEKKKIETALQRTRFFFFFLFCCCCCSETRERRFKLRCCFLAPLLQTHWHKRDL